MKKNLVAFLLFSSAFSLRMSAQYSLVDAYPNLPNFSNAVEIVKANDGTNRLFVVQQRGLIYVFEDSPTVSQRKLFLDLSSVVSQTGSETGLLGMALHPNYAQNRTFFLYYTTGSPLRSEVARFQTSTQNPDSAIFSSRQVILTEPQPFSNHNGGKIAFGHDGYLYISLGDGGSAGDPGNRAQTRNTILGKLLRIDVDNVQSPLNYAIPPTNPFVGQPNVREEIFAWGLRNMWKFSFDEQGRIWGADVGQNAWEDVKRVYLDELPESDFIASALFELLIVPETRLEGRVRKIAQAANQLELSLLVKILSYKNLTKEEVRNMLGIEKDLFQETVFYKEVFEEGKQEGKQEGR